MKSKFYERGFLALITALVLCVGCNRDAQTAPAAGEKEATSETAKSEVGPVEQEVDRILKDLQKFLETEKPTSLEPLKPFFDRFEKLYADNRQARPEEAPMALLTAVNLYIKFFGQPEKAMPYFERLAKDYEGTPTGRNAQENVEGLKDFLARQAEREKLMLAQQEAMFAQIRAQQEAAGIFLGKPMPDFTRTDTDGNEMSLSALEGNPVILVFWASWCGPCMQEAPNIKAVYEEFKGKGLKVLGINKDDTPVAMQRAVDRVGLPWPQHQDMDDSLSIQFAAGSLPTIYVIDAQGNLAASGLEVRGPHLRQTVAKLFADTKQ